MANVVYFLPGVESDQVDLRHLARCGLAHAFDRQPFCVPVRTGPSGVPGLMVADPGRCDPGAIGYYANRQTWHPLAGLDAWIGHDGGSPWLPEEFSRPKQRSGALVELRGGVSWLVPVARSFDMEAERLTYSVRLPRELVCDSAGMVHSGPVVPEWQHLWDLACRWHDVRLAGFFGRVIDGNAGAAEVAFTDQEIVDGAATVLAANYYIGKPEMVALKLCDDETIIRPLDVLADWPQFVAWYQKKTQEVTRSVPAGTTSGSPGAAAYSPATVQP